MSKKTKEAPRYQIIFDYVVKQITQQRWRANQMIPTEQVLGDQFAVSRMTVNKALTALVNEGWIQRKRGFGSYVAPQKYQATILEVRNIADEIKERGHQHTTCLYRLKQSPADERLAQVFGVQVGTMLFHSVLIHHENEEPIQIEDRWVNPQIAPHYLEQDFSSTTPNAYLLEVAPLQGASFSIEALPASKDIADRLHINKGDVCLVVKRTTFSNKKVASTVVLWHPANRYQLTGKVGQVGK
jgi:GntR family histidine utilization transcriptional repressor